MDRVRRCSLLLFVLVLTSLMPPTQNFGTSSAIAAPNNDPPPPAVLSAPPATQSNLPSLAIELLTTPGMVSVGNTLTATITLRNQAVHTAHEVVVRLPVAPGTSPLAGAGLISATKGWEWKINELAGNTTTTLTATMQLQSVPPGNALVLTPAASARDLTMEVHTTGGALVVEQEDRPATVPFTPGSPARLRSPDGVVNVQIPADASARGLSIRYARKPQANEPLPPYTAGRKRGLSPFFLTATDNQGKNIHQFAKPLAISVGYTPQQLDALGIVEDDLTLFWFDPTGGESKHGQWIPIATSIDSNTRTAHATVDHFTAFTLGDGSSPSAAFIPSLEGWQAGLYTGNVSYSLPIDVPAGPNGIKPNLALTYNSSATDGLSGKRKEQQGGWAGKGWSLDLGSIALNKVGDGSEQFYSLVLDGKSHSLVRGPALVSPADRKNPTHWEWRATDESFIKVRAIAHPDGPSYPSNGAPAGRGIQHWGTWLPRYAWQIWTKDGTIHEFKEDLWWGFVQCDAGITEGFETYRWLLSKQTDPNGNWVNYNYVERNADPYSGLPMTSLELPDQCPAHGHPQGTVDYDVWPWGITWGGNSATGTPYKYSVSFRTAEQLYDTGGTGSDTQMGGADAWPRTTQYLTDISVYGKDGQGTGQIRRYHFDYDWSLLSDASTANADGTHSAITEYAKLTLKKITQFGKDNVSSLPPMQFTYNGGASFRGTAFYPNGGWNRLTGVDNGQGGQVEFGYENIGAAVNNNALKNDFVNHHRVKSKTLRDGQGRSFSWNYEYQNAAYNSVGTLVDAYVGAPGPYSGTSTQAYPNSAVLYLNEFGDPYHDRSQWLLQRPKTEFRGHGYVKETAPNGGQTEHWFIQGDVGCYPMKSGTTEPLKNNPTAEPPILPIYDHACFIKLRNQEMLKGRELRTRVSTPGGTRLTEVEHEYTVDFYGYGGVQDERQTLNEEAGLWRAFTYESATEERTFEGQTTPVTKRTTYQYDLYDPATGDATNWVNGAKTSAKYGNLALVQEHDRGTLVRSTRYYYAIRDDASNPTSGTRYLANRSWATLIFDPASNILAYSASFYDGNSDPRFIGTQGRLTRGSKLYSTANPPVTTLSGTLGSIDTTYGYNALGLVTSETTYADPSTSSVSNSVRVWTAPSSTTAATTTTLYDDPATTLDETPYGLPVQIISRPNANKQLVEKATYDYVSAALTSVTDPNNNVTSASYDEFGRMKTLVKPGDTPTSPTVKATYYNYESAQKPWRYVVQRKGNGAIVGDIREIQQFYDGMGRLIQAKSESLDGAQNIVVDKQYDGLGNVLRSSQPRYVSETPSTTFWTLRPLDPDLDMRWTSTSYDALNRPTSITNPDNSSIGYRYSIVEGMTFHDVVDANRHRTYSMYDALGRRVKVRELTGNCSPSTAGIYYWASYACNTTYSTAWADASTSAAASGATYEYNPLDLLTKVTDGHGNLTTMQYDAVGRKLRMSDPDMGAWQYSYDGRGNLKTQTDTKNQTITFVYDDINRLKAKAFPDGSNVNYQYDENVLNGQGQRTSMHMSNQTASTNWQYDNRGRKVREAHLNINLLSERVFDWSYDSADRVTTMTYPNIGGTREVLTYSYDAAWRQTKVCTNLEANLCYASSTQQSTALDQPTAWQLGNGLVQTWSYANAMARLDRTRVAASGATTGIFDRSYSYDPNGNVSWIHDRVFGQQQNFTYDDRDRLVRAWTTNAAIGAAPSSGFMAYNSAPSLSVSQQAVHIPEMSLQLGSVTSNMQTGAEPFQREAVATPDTSADASAGQQATAAAATETAWGKLPLAFVPNRGQSDAAVRFQLHGKGKNIFFTPQEIVLAPYVQNAATDQVAVPAVVRLRYDGANRAPKMRAGTLLPGVVNYLRGNDSTKWQTNVPTYRGIVYDQLYPGIDLQYDGNDGQLKSTYVVAAGSDPAKIRWRYDGAASLQVDAASGNLVISLPALADGSTPQITEHAPIAWQDINGQRVPVAAQFKVNADNSVQFTLGHYDATQPLIIDPVLSYSTYLGGAGNDEVYAIAIDSSGNAYVTGRTTSSDFPVSGGPQSTKAANIDAFITKLNASGSAVMYSTYVGGGGDDRGHGIAVDSSGRPAIVGQTSAATNFPLKNAYDATAPAATCAVGTAVDTCDDAFITQLAADGASLRYSSYLGGTGDDAALGIGVDTNGRLYVAGWTTGDLPQASSYDTDGYNTGAADAFVATFDPALTGSASLLSSTYLGGSGDDKANGIAVDSSGNVVVAGETNSTTFPTKNARQTSNGGSYDAFVTKLTPGVSGSTALLYSTYLGASSEDKGFAVAVDGSNNAYVTGHTLSTSFPTVNGYQTAKVNDKEVFVAKINTAGSGAASLVYSTYLTGDGEDRGLAIGIDGSGRAYVTGSTKSTNFPSRDAVQTNKGDNCVTATTSACTDAFVASVNPTLSGDASLLYSTYLGGTSNDYGYGIAVDSSGNSYVGGRSDATGLPNASPYDTYNAGRDGFVAKLSVGSTSPTQPTVTLSSSSTSVNESAGTAILTVNLSAASTQSATVTYATSNGTATAGSDYTAASGTLTIAAGQTSGTISVQVVNDLADEPDETLSLNLSSPTNATLGTPSSSTITIVDNDDPPYQPAAYDESYAYDKIGNLTSKAGVSQQYGSNLNGTGAGPHQVRSRGGASYSYDANGNLQSGGNRSYTWTYENQIASVTVTTYNPETYAYNADGERVTRSTGTLTTVYEGGLYEHDVQTARTRVQYLLNGQTVAQRTRASGENTVHYMHADHLGSVSMTTDGQGTVVSRADFKPFGEERSWSGTSPTTLNFTGQRKDATGLLYYGARYYDPAMARFISADSIVPGSASGGMDGQALKPLTVDFHEIGFASRANEENQYPFWFQLNDQERQKLGSLWGPSDAQGLNRYSYVLNNPLRYTDPTGHLVVTKDDAAEFLRFLDAMIAELEDDDLWQRIAFWLAMAPITGGASAILGFISKTLLATVTTSTALGILGVVSNLLSGPDFYGYRELLNIFKTMRSAVSNFAIDTKAATISINLCYSGNVYTGSYMEITSYNAQGKVVAQYGKTFVSGTIARQLAPQLSTGRHWNSRSRSGRR